MVLSKVLLCCTRGFQLLYFTTSCQSSNYIIFTKKTSVSLTQYWAGDKIKKNEMGGACSAYGGGERRVQGFGGET